MSRIGRAVSTLLVLLTSAAAALATAAPAGATLPPGENGLITFESGAGVNGGDVWIAKADGAGPKQLSKDKQSIFASPAWTPDGQYVIVSRQTQLPWGAFELWMYHVKGGSGVQVTKAKAKPDAPPDQWFNAVGAVASPDSQNNCGLKFFVTCDQLVRSFPT